MVVALDLAINHGKKVWWVSPTYNNVMTHWRTVRKMVGTLPTYQNVQHKFFAFAGGGELHFKSGDRPDNLRGEGLDYVVLDEAAFMNPDLWYAVIRPALSDRKGGALIISTPNGLANWFYRVFRLGVEGEKKERDWQSWKFSTVDNPFIDPEEVRQAKEDLPELKFRQEYLAEFVEDAGGVFVGAWEAATAMPQDGPIEGHKYIAGVDWGRKHDFTVISILDATTRQQAAIIRFTDIGFRAQRTRLIQAIEYWGLYRVYAEANAISMSVVEALLEDGYSCVKPVMMTNETKRDMIERLTLALQRKDLIILNAEHTLGEIQLAELLSYEIQRTPGGLSFTYRAPRGYHDDTVIALALANSGLSRTKKSRLKGKRQNPFYKYRSEENARSRKV